MEAEDAEQVEEEAAEAGEANAAEGDGKGTWDKLPKIAQELIKAGFKLAADFGLMVGIAKLMQQLDPSVPGNSQMTADVNNCTTAIKLLQAAVKDWGQWLQDNVDNRAQFGSVTVAGMEIEKWQLLKGQVDTLVDDISDQLQPAVAALKADQSQTNVTNLKVAVILVTDDALTICTGIKTSYQDMAAAGLKDHSLDVQEALAQLHTQSFEFRAENRRSNEDLMAEFNAMLPNLPAKKPELVTSVSATFTSLNNMMPTLSMGQHFRLLQRRIPC